MRFVAELFSRLSLRNRFRFLLLLVVVTLTIITVVLLPRIYLRGMIDSSHGVLYAQANDFEQRYLQHPTAQPVQTSEIHSYLSLAEIPETFRSHFAVPELEYNRPYLEEWHEGGTIIVCYFYKSRVGDTGLTLYQFKRIDIQKRPEHAFSTIRNIQWGFAGGGLILVLAVSGLLVGQVVRPIAALHQWLTDTKLGAPPGPLPPEILNDEIGHVAHGLRSSLQTNFELRSRERQFIQSASHELRTPIAVIQSAAELARKQIELGRGDIHEPLARIERSCAKMKNLTESLLWLNRISTHEVETSPVHVKQCVEATVQELSAIAGNDWAISYIGNCGAHQLPQILFEICIKNLLSNAFQHASQRSVNITLSEGSVSVGNAAEGAMVLNQDDIISKGVSSAGGFGVGLMLTAKIAAALDWHFTLSIKDGWAEFTLIFSPTDNTESNPGATDSTELS